MARESDIIDVDDSSSHSSDSAVSIGGLCNDSTRQALPENRMPPPPNQASRLVAAMQMFLDSHERALGVSLVQPPPESQVPSSHTSSAPAVSQQCPSLLTQLFLPKSKLLYQLLRTIRHQPMQTQKKESPESWINWKDLERFVNQKSPEMFMNQVSLERWIMAP